MRVSLNMCWELQVQHCSSALVSNFSCYRGVSTHVKTLGLFSAPVFENFYDYIVLLLLKVKTETLKEREREKKVFFLDTMR